MNEESQNFVNYSNRVIVRGFLGLVLVAVLLLILPLYMQNRMTRLYAKSHELSEAASMLRREILQQELEINKLSSLERLNDFAETAELGLNQVPTKVRVVGGAK